MNNEEKGKALSRVKGNVFDVAVVLLVLFTLLVFWQKNNLMKIFENDRTKNAFAVAFEITDVRYDLVNDLAAGTVMYTVCDDATVELGMMLDEPVITSLDATLTEGDTMVDLAGTLSCHGVLREGALVVDQALILAVGEELFVATEISNMQIRVISITEIR